MSNASWEKFERDVTIEVTLKVTDVSAKGALKITEAAGAAEVEGGTVVVKRSRNGQVYFNLTHPEESEPEVPEAVKRATPEQLAAFSAFLESQEAAAKPKPKRRASKRKPAVKMPTVE